MDSVDRAIERIKEAGFNFIKVELEADFYRDDSQECHNCEGAGRVTCSGCGGDGIITSMGEDIECGDCEGYSDEMCYQCDGDGTLYDRWEDDACREMVLSGLTDEQREYLVYSHFENDGSVDSEFTFTIPVEKAKELPDFIRAFTNLEDEIGNGMDTGGAGMHMTLLLDSEFPSYRRLDTAKAGRFKVSMNRLLPALWFLASPDDVSRGIGYRAPRVCEDEKYSAIFTHRDTCIEYRLFETTYRQPEAILDNVEVIANTLKFYSHEPPEIERMGERFGFSDAYGTDLARFYNTPQKVMILKKQLKHLKPEGTRINELMRSRGVKGITELRKEQSRERAKARREWHRQNKLVRDALSKRLNNAQRIRVARELADYRRYNYVESLDERQFLRERSFVARGVRIMPSLQEHLRQALGHHMDSWQVSV